MRRRLPTYDVNWTAYKLLRDFGKERLRLIGAIAMEWNYIEDMIDECLILSFSFPWPLGPT